MENENSPTDEGATGQENQEQSSSPVSPSDQGKKSGGQGHPSLKQLSRMSQPGGGAGNFRKNLKLGKKSATAGKAAGRGAAMVGKQVVMLFAKGGPVGIIILVILIILLLAFFIIFFAVSGSSNSQTGPIPPGGGTISPLTITKSTPDTNVTVGSIVRYTITVNYSGTANDILVQDQINPNEAAFGSTPQIATCNTGICDNTSTSIIWSVRTNYPPNPPGKLSNVSATFQLNVVAKKNLNFLINQATANVQ